MYYTGNISKTNYYILNKPAKQCLFSLFLLRSKSKNTPKHDDRNNNDNTTPAIAITDIFISPCFSAERDCFLTIFIELDLSA